MNKRIGVLVPEGPSAAAAAKILLPGANNNNDEGKQLFHILPVSRSQAAEDVSLCAASRFDGFLNLCHGRRADCVSAPDVVDALDQMCIAYYSGATPHSVKFNRSDIAALAFYAAEDNEHGFVVPCHGTVRNINNNGASSSSSAPSMVDCLKFPVSVRPNKFLRAGDKDGAIVAVSIEERVAAQKHFFSQGHAAVFVQEEEQAAEKATTTAPLEVFLLCSAQWASSVKRSAVSVLISEKPIDDFFSTQQKGSSNDNDDEKKQLVAQLQKIGESLFRGIFDDASCASTLRGHCLIHLVGNKQPQQQQPAWEWRVDDIEPNCCIITPEKDNDDSSICRAFQHVIKPRFGASSSSLSTFLLSLVGFDAPPRYVAPAFKVEYDPRHKWYGLTAARDLQQGQIVFHDEATSFTLVTKPFVEANWSDEMKVVFSRYAWPVSGPEPTSASSSSSSLDQHVYAIWSEDPSKWRPINHHCEPNLHFAVPHSLNCVAARDIKQGDMLTLDYATFCDWTMKPFMCKCGAQGCRGLIEPTAEALAGYGDKAWHRMAPSRSKHELVASADDGEKK